MEVDRAAGESGAEREAGVASGTAAVAAVRRKLGVPRAELDDGHSGLHVSSGDQHAAVYGRKNSRGNCESGSAAENAARASGGFEEFDCAGREDGAAESGIGAK